MAVATSTILAAAAIGTSLGSMYLSSKKPKNTQTPTAPTMPEAPKPVEPEIAKRKRKVGTGSTSGRQGTLLTGPQGLTGAAPTVRKTLLGS